jgi:hypothetical protein
MNLSIVDQYEKLQNILICLKNLIEKENHLIENDKVLEVNDYEHERNLFAQIISDNIKVISEIIQKGSINNFILTTKQISLFKKSHNDLLDILKEQGVIINKKMKVTNIMIESINRILDIDNGKSSLYNRIGIKSRFSKNSNSRPMALLSKI